MATTARQVCKSALRKILAETDAVEPTAAELADVLESFNDMMHALMVMGARIGHQTLALDDNVNLDEGHIKGVKAMLAVEIAPEFGAAVDPQVAFAASEGRKALQSDTQLAVPTQLDSALLRRRRRYYG
ncbi:MAG: hypothetical protein ACR2QF_10255 [Geminicoccaceae bacterium]